jgi:hypothetical protein
VKHRGPPGVSTVMVSTSVNVEPAYVGSAAISSMVAAIHRFRQHMA